MPPAVSRTAGPPLAPRGPHSRGRRPHGGLREGCSALRKSKRNHDVGLVGRAGAEARVPGLQVWHRRPFYVYVQPAVGRRAERYVSHGEGGSGNVLVVFEVGVHDGPGLDGTLERSSYCGRVSLLWRRPGQTEEGRPEGGPDRAELVIHPLVGEGARLRVLGP